MKIVEGLCYVYPHKPELVAEHRVMTGVWHKCLSLLRNGSVLAPLLVDDRPQDNTLCTQSVERLIWVTTGREYKSLSWLGEAISESALEDRYGTLGCDALDALYHLEVLGTIAVLIPDWKWVVVHPISFQDQQSAMLGELWERLALNADLTVVAERLRKNKDILRAEMRQSILNRFCHHWVGHDGRVQGVTRPVYARKKIFHEPVEAD